MEYIKGVTLEVLYRHLTPLQKLGAFALTAYATSIIHAEGIVHRDLKPENLIIDLKGNLKVIDFGIAETKGAWIDRDDARRMSLQYAPPELFEVEDKEFDDDHGGPSYTLDLIPAVPSMDIYSLGIILFYIYNNRYPKDFFAHDASREQAFANRVIDSVFMKDKPTIEEFGDIPYFLWVFLNKLTAKNPRERIQASEEVTSTTLQLLYKQIQARKTSALSLS